MTANELRDVVLQWARVERPQDSFRYAAATTLDERKRALWVILRRYMEEFPRILAAMPKTVQRKLGFRVIQGTPGDNADLDHLVGILHPAEVYHLVPTEKTLDT